MTEAQPTNFLVYQYNRLHTIHHTHVQMHAHTPPPPTHTHTHILKSLQHLKHSYCHPANQYWDACATLRHLSPVQTNPPGTGLPTVEQSRSHGEVMELKDSNTAKQDKGCWAFAPQVPIDVTAGWTASPGHQVPNIQRGRLEQCE